MKRGRLIEAVCVYIEKTSEGANGHSPFFLSFLLSYLLLLLLLLLLADHKDAQGLQEALTRMKKMVATCNDRMATVEDRMTMIEIDKSLDYSRLDQAVRLTEDVRSLVKSGPLSLCTISNNKVVKSKQVNLHSLHIFFGSL